MGLLTDFYNTVARFFRPQEDEVDNSKTVATNRLKLVLMQDRTNLTPKILEQMRGELVDLLSKYLEMDKELLELNFEQEGDQVALMLSIPVIRAKDEEEIEAAIKESASKSDSEEDEDDEESEESDETSHDDEEDECSDEVTGEVSEEVSEEEDSENIETEDVSEDESEDEEETIEEEV